MPKSLAISTPTASDLKSQQFKITAMSVAISTVFSTDWEAIRLRFCGALRDFIKSELSAVSNRCDPIAVWNRCDCDFAIWAHKVRREKKKYTPKVFSALKTQVPQQAERGLVYTKRLVFEGKRREIHMHQRAFQVCVCVSVCGGPLCTAFVYRFWPPKGITLHKSLSNYSCNCFAPTVVSGWRKRGVEFKGG